MKRFVKIIIALPEQSEVKHAMCLCSLHIRHDLYIEIQIKSQKERTFRRKDYNTALKLPQAKQKRPRAMMDSITLECCKIFDVPWRYQANFLLSPRDAEVLFWLLRTSVHIFLFPLSFLKIYHFFTK